MIISRRALQRLSLLGLVASPLLSPAAADAVAGVGKIGRSKESSRILAGKAEANAFILGKFGTSNALGFATEDCDTSALTMVQLDLSSSFQMWKYDGSTSAIQSIACPDKVVNVSSSSCDLVEVSVKASVADNFQTFSFQDVVGLSDGETTGVTIKNAGCPDMVLSDGSSSNASIGMRENENGSWLFIDLSYGNNYFHPLRKYTSAASDLNYAASISMSTDGSRIAISGSEPDGDKFRGFAKLFDSDKTLLHTFTTESVDEVTPIVNVVLSGDGKILAIGAVFPTGEGLVSGVEVFDLATENNQDEQYGQIGTIIAAGIMGDLPGLRLDMSEDGSTLIVGGRNYDSGRGRVRVYTIDTSADDVVDQIKPRFEWKGVGSNDHLGSSVSASRTGQYMAIGGTGFIKGEDGPMTGAVKVYDTVKGKFVGGVIYGTSANDATGFSVDLVEIGDILYVAVASIFSGVEGNSDRGKVDIFKWPSSSVEDVPWEKVGKSLVGDRGATLDFVNGNYHIGDSFGFSLGLAKMGENGLRVAVGSPFFSNLRESDAYYGVVKLFEYSEDEESWAQIAYDIVGNTRTSASGTSIALVNGGDTLAIGGGPDGTSNGNVIVYAQEETSSKPSSMPSTLPSNEPSSHPSSVPSFRPSSIPSKEPSSAPSSQPSSVPSKEPSSVPSSVPSSQPSSIPSNEPSSVPSSQPSSIPSKEPSSVPSSIPSSQPSSIPSKEPSSVPISIPSSHPSSVPSEKPSSYPSSAPSSQPSSVPSEKPSSYPSNAPSSQPSSVPSEKPSSYPSNTPSSHPSFVPSKHPSNIPSSRPSISHEPSSQPSNFEDREFMILSTFKKLTDLPMGAREDKNWCLERLFSAVSTGGNPLKMRPCESGHNRQMWIYDRQESVIKSSDHSFCIERSGKQLVSTLCTATSVNTLISPGALNLNKKGDDQTHGSISIKTVKNEFYFAVDSFRIFSRVKLLKKGTENSSFDKWQLRYKGPSEFPSSIPSSNPSNKPSTRPSMEPSTEPNTNGANPSITSTSWRILNQDPSLKTVWDIVLLELYDNSDCTGSTLTSSNMFLGPLESNNCCGNVPERAFDDDVSSLWGGRPDANDDMFLGATFRDSVEVKCAVFVDGNSNGAWKSRIATLQMQDKDNSWVDVMSFNQNSYLTENLPRKILRSSMEPERLENISLLDSSSAWQSHVSSAHPNSADRAIDNDTSGVWANDSVTDTGYQESPSWHVTWPAAHRISRIKVWNRTDPTCSDGVTAGEYACGERLVGFVLTVFLDGHKMWSSAESAVGSSINKEMYDFKDIPSHIVGDKVEVKLSGIAQALSLAEVEVFGLSKEIYNVARNKNTEQSSDHAEKSVSNNAVDGDVRPESEVGHGINLSITNNQNSPYWHVLLGSPVVIDTIVIHNRNVLHNSCDGGNCSSRLRGFRMEILNVVNGNESVVHTYDDHSPIDPGLVIYLPIPAGIIGNKVRISIPGRKTWLQLREVQVFSSVGCFDLNGDANDRLCQAPNLKVAYYKDNLDDDGLIYAGHTNVLLPVDGLLSLAPYQTDLDFGRDAISFSTGGEVFTSGRSDNVAARFVGYAIFDVGIYDICSDSDDQSKVYIDGVLIVESNFDKGRKCETMMNAEAGVKRVVVEYKEGPGGARCKVEWKPPGGTYDDLPFISV